MSGTIPNVSARTRKIFEMARHELDDYNSDDSYLHSDGEDNLYLPSDRDESQSDQCNDSDSELEEEEDPNLQPDSNDDHDDDANSVAEASNARIFYGKKNCISWSSEPQSQFTKTPQKNIMKIKLSTCLGTAKELANNPEPDDVWRLFFTDVMVNEVVVNTNKKLESMRGKLQNPDSTSYKNTDHIEIEALFGLLVLCCIYKSSGENLSSLFSTTSKGRPIFRATMSLKRCNTLLLALRFDNSETRTERKQNDPAAAISNIFQMFIESCQKLYSISAHACIDESLIPFRGRCPFRIYMSMKPARYGIKVVCMTDAHTAYLYNAYIYLGKDSDGITLSADERKFQKPTQAVIRLAKCIYGTNRNITCDNWFSSIEVANVLLKNKLTFVGTMKANKKEIPKEFLHDKNKPIGSSIYGYTKDLTLLSYVAKKSKSVFVLSSMHKTAFTDERNGKPELISFYNATKSGVDTMDMKCSNYSANRRTRRWPLAVFYYLISVSCANAYVVFLHKGQLSRFDFMEKLGVNLIKKHMLRRLNIPYLSVELKELITKTLKEFDVEVGAGSGHYDRNRTDTLDKKTTCRYCPYTKKRKTQYKCIKCETPNCLECSKKICNNCVTSL